MGRKIEIRKIENATRRQITFSKRKTSLLRKSKEISILCDVDVALLTYAPSGRLSKFCSKDRYFLSRGGAPIWFQYVHV